MSKSFPNTGAITGTNADRLALSGVCEGMQFFETDTNKMFVYDGSSWVEIADIDNPGGLSDAGLNQTARIFTNEAARNAAIPSPFEGQVAILTAPTVPAGGPTSIIPPTVETYYNGTSWVCRTPVSGIWSSGSYRISTSYGLPANGTNVYVTTETGTSAKISLNGRIYNDQNGGEVFAAVAVTTSGNTVAASDEFALHNSAGLNQIVRAGVSFVLPNIPASTANTFQVQFRNTTGAIVMSRIQLIVEGI